MDKRVCAGAYVRAIALDNILGGNMRAEGSY